MGALIPYYITGFDKGFVNNKKPFLNSDEAWTVLENAFCFRESVRKREGLRLLGRLRRTLTDQPIGVSGASPWTFTIYSTLVPAIVGEPNAEIEPGSVIITIHAGPDIVFTDLGAGILTSPTAGNSGTINYITGSVTLTHTAGPGVATTISFSYFPSLPVMGISRRDLPAINDEETVWFDQKYSYRRSGSNFFELIATIPTTTWNGSDSDFFWTTNYRGANPQDKLFFVTNFFNNAGSPMRYTDGATWTTFAPLFIDPAPVIGPTSTIFQARIIVSYYNRLLLLNTWEGDTAAGPAFAVNIQNRCRFSGPAFGNPIAADAFLTNKFGLGGVIDAPTSEAIIGAMFVKNTLIVLFEQTTWQLTYVGEYGLPFVWERVSADFGSESTFSSVLYENQMLAIGDKAIMAANANNVQRIDLEIPNQIFNFKNTNNGVKRVWGVRDYQRELIYWNYPDANTIAGEVPVVALTYPNKVLVYNYRNNTWAIFRDNVTAFGTYQLDSADVVTWESTTVTWDDPIVTWDDIQTDPLFPAVVSGNQQGFVHAYGYALPDEPSLTIEAINLTGPSIIITSVNHNLLSFEIIQITGMKFVDSSTYAPLVTDLNDKLYQVQVITPDTFSISRWDFTSSVYQPIFPFVPPAAGTLYIGGGRITLYPRLNVQSKDINVFQDKGYQVKLAYIDFLMEQQPDSAFSIVLALNSCVGLQPAVVGNMLTGNKNLSTDPKPPFYTPGSNYAWFRFFATTSCQFFRINMTYDDALMNTPITHANPWTLYAIQAYVRPGSRTQFS